MKEVSSKTPTERVPLTFDFTDQLASAETISGTPVCTFTDVRGTDSVPTISFQLSGATTVNGALVQQLVVGGKLGEIYEVTCTANTSNNQILQLALRVPVRDLADT